MKKQTELTSKNFLTPKQKKTEVVMQHESKEVKENPVLTKNISPILYRAKGVWPFDFRPDEITVEEKRIVVHFKYFPFGSYIGTMNMDKLSSIEVSHSLFFSSITIESSELHGFNTKINWLTNKDAHRIKEIVDGLKVQELAKVHIPHSKPSNVSKTLESLGRI